MNKGTVKWFNVRKGYGFITQEDGKDIFVHYSGIQAEGFKKLKPDDHVTYDVTTDANNREVAINVSVA